MDSNHSSLIQSQVSYQLDEGRNDLAEDEGFEPVVAITPIGLANRANRPLWQSSIKWRTVGDSNP